jgi:cell division protein FtsN
MAQQARRKSHRTKGKSRARAKSSAASIGMLAIGLVSGAVLAVLYLGMRSGQDHGVGSGLKTLFAKTNVTATPPPPAPVAPLQQPAKTKFDFYTVLPAIERVIPESDFTDKQGIKPKRQDRGYYVLQVASYANARDADRLKAKLALSGLHAPVQRIMIENKGVYYRVRVGPYTDKRQLKNTKQKLAKLGYRGIALRLSSQ